MSKDPSPLEVPLQASGRPMKLSKPCTVRSLKCRAIWVSEVPWYTPNSATTPSRVVARSAEATASCFFWVTLAESRRGSDRMWSTELSTARSRSTTGTDGTRGRRLRISSRRMARSSLGTRFGG